MKDAELRLWLENLRESVHTLERHVLSLEAQLAHHLRLQELEHKLSALGVAPLEATAATPENGTSPRSSADEAGAENITSIHEWSRKVGA